MSISHFCKKMGLARSSFYYKPKGESEENLAIMRRIDEHHTAHPAEGVRKIQKMLENEGVVVNKKRVRRLMRLMCIETVYSQRCLSKHSGKACYKMPYLLRNLTIDHPNQVWSTDISYIAMEHGFMYLYAIIDVYSRCILGWTLDNTLAAENCTRLVDECVGKYGAPDILNSDQGSQYTSQIWKECLEGHGILVSMDGRGRCKDNIWIERFWRTVKQEYVYLHPTGVVNEMRDGIGWFINYYNTGRPHEALGYEFPCQMYKLTA